MLMPNRGEQRVICPYFHRFGSNGVTIVCEGLADDTSTGIIFRTGADRRGWSKAWCETYSYSFCPLARVLEKME